MDTSGMTASIVSSDVGSLRALREARGLTQVDVARRAGCSVSYIRLLEAGGVPHKSRVLPDVLRVLVPKRSEGLAGNEPLAMTRDQTAPDEDYPG
jgi:transcriptional regulator with XRE-family HTH domain